MKIKESEEKMKNSFNWDSNKKDEMEGVLPTGEKIEIIGDGIYKTPDVPENHIVANENVKKRVRTPEPPKKSKLDVGIGSSGFTSMITLASIIVIAGIIIAYIIFKV